MKNNEIKELTNKLNALVLRNRNEEQRLIQQIQTLQEEQDYLRPGTRVRYATNGTFNRYNTGTVVRQTTARTIIKIDKHNTNIYRARKNVRKLTNKDKTE